MNPETFFENLDLLYEAPNSVQKLRELILQLAVMGKLVPQDPNDEPASVLLERIKAEKRRLFIKENSLPSIENEETPFGIPQSWEWVRLGEVVNYNGAQKISSENLPDDAWILDLEDIEKNTSKILNRVHFKDKNSKSTKAEFKKGNVLYGNLRPYLNKVVVADEDGYCTTEIVPLSIYTGIDPFYLMYALKRPDFLEYVNSKTYGTKMPRLGTDDARKSLLPLPPLAEQKRIVSKIDELMALCDKLEARRQKKQEIQSKLNSASLDRMLSAENQEEFEQYWQRICENFDLLYDNPENVGKLRQVILQLAVQGKLVPQNPEDEPASVLIEKIKEEKKRLVKTGKIKNSKSSLIIGQDEIDQNKMISYLPDGWEMIRLEELGEFCGGGTPSTNNPEYWGEDIAWVSPKDMKESRIKNSEMKIAEKALEETRLRLIPQNSILIVARSGILKRLLPVSINDIECTVNQDLKVIIPFYSEISGYIQLMLKGYESFILENLVKGGMTVQSLKYAEFEKAPFPLPPLNEQKRIVEKVEQFMGLCDELESKLRKEREDNEKLMEAVVKGLLESAAAEKTEFEKPIPVQVTSIQLK